LLSELDAVEEQRLQVLVLVQPGQPALPRLYVLSEQRKAGVMNAVAGE
jgi:hypothetical protein